MKLQKYSTVCFATLLSIGVFSFSAQATTQKESFFYGVLSTLKSKPNLPGDDQALEYFSLMNDAGKDGVFEMGTVYCSALKEGNSSQNYMTGVKERVNALKSSQATKDSIWSLYVAAAVSAKAKICPE